MLMIFGVRGIAFNYIKSQTIQNISRLFIYLNLLKQLSHCLPAFN